MTFTCDMAWDIVLMVWWLCLVLTLVPLADAIAATAIEGGFVERAYFRGGLNFLTTAMCGLLFVLFLISAVLSGLVRKRLLMLQKCDTRRSQKSDVEVGRHPAAGECDLTPPGVHCGVTRAAEPAGLAVVGVGKV
jgi:hypothetical protein